MALESDGLMKTLRLTEQQYASLKRRTVKLAAELVAKPENGDRWPDMLRDQIVQAGLPTPEREYRWHPTRKFRADLAWPDRMFLAEIDGAVHRIKSKFARDIERHNLLVREGWVYIRVTPDMVRSGEALQWVKEFVE